MTLILWNFVSLVSASPLFNSKLLYQQCLNRHPQPDYFMQTIILPSEGLETPNYKIREKPNKINYTTSNSVFDSWSWKAPTTVAGNTKSN